MSVMASVEMRLLGFHRPLRLSDELKEFLSVDPETQLSRCEVHRRIAQYIMASGLLLSGSNLGRSVTPDAKLAKLFNVCGDPPAPLPMITLGYHIKRHIMRL